MEIANLEKIQKIPTLASFYVPFSAGTSHPFVTCHEEDVTDQVWIFETEEQCREFAKNRMENEGDPLHVVIIQQNQSLQFFSSLFFLGIDEIVFTEEKDMTRIPLTNLVKRPNYDEIPPEKRPLFNPQMQLTGIKLMQEVHRRAKAKPTLHDLEDEMIANLMRCQFLVVTAMLEPDEEPNEENSKRIPCIRDKNGIQYQPVFTDSHELIKFTANRKFKAFLMTFEEVQKLLTEEVNGIVVNPHSLNLIFTSDKIPEMIRQYKGED